jgi:hypothetical protein
MKAGDYNVGARPCSRRPSGRRHTNHLAAVRRPCPPRARSADAPPSIELPPVASVVVFRCHSEPSIGHGSRSTSSSAGEESLLSLPAIPLGHVRSVILSGVTAHFLGRTPAARPCSRKNLSSRTSAPRGLRSRRVLFVITELATSEPDIL